MHQISGLKRFFSQSTLYTPYHMLSPVICLADQFAATNRHKFITELNKPTAAPKLKFISCKPRRYTFVHYSLLSFLIDYIDPGLIFICNSLWQYSTY